MSTTFFALMITTMLAALGALCLGLFSMAKGGAFARKYGNRLMRARVILQAAALALFALTILTAKR
jgi:Hypoxia induced protein conserved region